MAKTYNELIKPTQKAALLIKALFIKGYKNLGNCVKCSNPTIFSSKVYEATIIDSRFDTKTYKFPVGDVNTWEYNVLIYRYDENFTEHEFFLCPKCIMKFKLKSLILMLLWTIFTIICFFPIRSIYKNETYFEIIPGEIKYIILVIFLLISVVLLGAYGIKIFYKKSMIIIDILVNTSADYLYGFEGAGVICRKDNKICSGRKDLKHLFTPRQYFKMYKNRNIQEKSIYNGIKVEKDFY